MTCIVAIGQNGNSWIGSDSGAWVNNVVHVISDTKIIQRGEFLFGYCGLRRFGDLLRYSFEPPIIDGDLDAYISTVFTDSLRCTLKDKGALKNDCGVESHESRFVVAVRGRVFYVDGCFAVHRPTENYVAIGCAEEAALAVLDVTEEMSPEDRIRLALTTAARRVDGVRPPFSVVSSKTALAQLIKSC